MVSSGSNVRSGGSYGEVPVAGYRQLAEFRYHIRKFLHFSEEAARSYHVEPQQRQFLLAIKGLPEGIRPTDEPLRVVVHRMAESGLTRLPVLDPQAERRLVGMISSTIFFAQDRKILKKNVRANECCESEFLLEGRQSIQGPR